MPELPEVETLRRNLERTLVARRFESATIGLPKVFITPTGLEPRDLVGKQIQRIHRRAKFLVLGLSGGLSLIFHFRLSGQLVHLSADGAELASGGHPVPAFGSPLPHKATHAIFGFDDGSLLYLTDIRQFGRIWLMPTSAVDEFLERYRLGPEPLEDDFGEAGFRARLARRSRMALKPLLLDQSFIGGVGNIYADEIAFEARLSPLAIVGDLGDERSMDLYRAIRSVLDHAVTHGVADVLDGRANPKADFPRVHGRAGQACRRCGRTIVKTRVAGRGTYSCPGCQGYPALPMTDAGRNRVTRSTPA
jgi:formamidopyrimidine-DNA glycosylase